MNKTAHIKVIIYFVRAFKNTKRIYLRKSKYFRKNIDTEWDVYTILICVVLLLPLLYPLPLQNEI